MTTLSDTDDGACDAHCSLREAIESTNAVAGRDTIRFAAALSRGTMPFADGAPALVITDDLVVNGDAGGLGITVDARQQDRVFRIGSPAFPLVDLAGLTITGGLTGGDGGGVLIEDAFDSGGALKLRRCTVAGNRAGGGGGGIYEDGSFFVEQSTISGNEAGGNGGGLSIHTLVEMRNSTISGDRAGGRGGGLIGYFVDIRLDGVTVTRNEAGDEGGGLAVSVGGKFGGRVDLHRVVVAGNVAAGAPLAPEADCFVSLLGGKSAPTS